MAKRPMRENASGPMPSMGLGVVVQAASVNASMAIKAPRSHADASRQRSMTAVVKARPPAA